jgi:NAD(P)-dependent dehydrogenase (short-subunit alcohol dehydrogenase family)
MDIAGKVAVVTGAASGIGRATALALAREGTDIVLSDINEDRLNEVRAEMESLGRKALTVRADVSKLADIQNLFAASIAAMGRVDILMNNAGVHMMGPIENVTLADWEWIVGINVWSVIYGIHVFLPHMLERGSGHIVNTGSIAGLNPIGEASIPYAATKCAVVGISEGLASYLRPKGIGVTVVCPGFVLTNIGKGGRLIPGRDGLDEPRNTLYRAFSEEATPEQVAVLSQILQAEIVSAESVAEKVTQAIKENKVRVLTHSGAQEWVTRRATDIENLIDEYVQRDATFQEMVKALAANIPPPEAG